MGMERLDVAKAKAADWEVERAELLKSLAAKEAMLVEEAGRNAGLAANLDEAQAMVEHFREEAKEEATQNAHLSYELDDAQTELARQEEDVRAIRGTNKRLISQRNMAKGEPEMALRGKAAELEFALAKQKAELEEKYVAKIKEAVGEESQKLAVEYKAQLPGIRDRAWELGWKAALKKVGVPGDSPIFRNPPKFLPCPSSQAPPATKR